MKAHDILTYLAIKHKGDWEKIFEALRKREPMDEEDALNLVKKLKCKAVTVIDPEYPQSLKRCDRPPFVLFYYGRLSLTYDERRCVSYIGSRDASSYGERMAKELAGGLAKNGLYIVSGMAKGIDAYAMEAALDEGDGVIGVLGSGIDIPYPSSNINLYKRLKKEGLVLSEYPADVPPRKENFPFRNRIIAALSKLTVVGEAKKRSGTSITVNYALEYGRDVACLPYRADEDSACNTLIQDGASLVTSVSDILNLVGKSFKAE